MINLLKNIIKSSESDELQALREENEQLKRDLARLKNARLATMGADSPLAKTTYSIIRDLLNKVDDASLLLSANGDLLFANDSFLKQHGLTRDKLKGKIYAPELGLVTKDRFEDRLNTARSIGGKSTYTRTINTPDGKEITMQVSLFIYNLLGTETIWYFFKDTTELEKSRSDVRELNNLLNSILDNLPVYLFVKDVDNDLRYLYWNKAFAEYSKIPASKVIGHTDFEVFPDYNDAQKFRNDDLEVISTSEPVNRHETYEAANGKTRIVQTLKTLIHREGRGPLLIGVSLDITNLSNIEQELVQERIKAEEADRLKTRFLANMSHEIRTPLNAIVGFSNMLIDTEDKKTRQEFAEIIELNNAMLLQLINDILDLSKIESGELEYSRAPMDLVETCHNIYEIQKNKVPKGVKLILDTPNYIAKEASDSTNNPNEFIIVEDRNRIAQVINNLINNAIKFTRNGEIRFGFNVNQDDIEVYVRDTGIGISTNKINMIFERFVKLDKFSQGTGLGLSICKLIVETFGGKMNVKSQVGQGSTFSFTIPLHSKPQKAETINIEQAPEQEVKETSAPAPAKAEHTNEKVILIAEDEQSNFLYVRALIKKRYTLLWAKDGNEAVQMFKDYQPDMIFMDIKMPNIDGIAATKLIRSYSKDVPIVALTANAFDSDRHMALDAGMNDYMSKPINRDLFEDILNKYLN